MILRKSLPSSAPQTGVSPCLPGSPGPAILGDKYYVRSLPQHLKYLDYCCVDHQLTNVSLFSYNYPVSGAQAME